MNPVKFGVIGVGGIGAVHAALLAQGEETQLVAVADVDQGRAERVARETGARPFCDYRLLVEASGAEAVIVAAPHPLHPAMAEDAARRGLHVLCEKPLATSVAAADRMLETCRRSGVLLGTVFQQRADPSRRAMKRLLEAGALGPLHRVSMEVSFYRPHAYYASAPWRGTWRGEGGGILMQAAHAFDQLAWLGGLPLGVQALTLTRLHDIEVENTAHALFDYGGGKSGWLYTSTAEVHSSERIEIAGDRGALLWEDGRLRHLSLPTSMSQHALSATRVFQGIGGTWRDIEVEAASEDFDEPYRQVIRAFARAVRQGEPSLMLASGEDGLRSLELANAVLLAGRCRQEVALPLDRDRYERLLQTLQSSPPAPSA